MGKYSIKELETLSGIKAHTIRIWEKRHRIIEPQRTLTNVRYYSDADLRKIINVSLLNNYGLKISKIAGMSDGEINSEVVQLTSSQNEATIFIDQFIMSMIDMEEEQFEKLLAHLIMKFGFERTVLEIVYPFLEKIGILWQTKNISPAQEHFISNLIRQKIIVAIDSLPFPAKDADKVVLFLPENELHEIGLLFYHFIVKKIGFRTFYLGQHLPYEDLRKVCQAYHPKFIITSLISTQKPQKTKIYIERLIADFPDSEVLASGNFSEALVPQSTNFKHFKNAVELKAILE
ncbi:MAG: MerR family transcriptional regulator [Cyclobacteriaceae bacterium]|nr:MerR family transcriptional regulator [Cyclobacteriaceae bacterium]